MKVVAGIVGGLILGLLIYFVVGIASASSTGGVGRGGIALLIAWAVALVVAIQSPSAAKAWRRLLIASGIAAFLLPLAGIVFTGSHMASTIDPKAAHAGAQAAGAAIGGTLVSGFLGFVGFFLGVVFLIIGLLVGREKQIVYVQAPPA